MAEPETKPVKKIYYLKKGRTHNQIVKGTLQKFPEGSAIELSDEQYEAFKDKFQVVRPDIAAKPAQEPEATSGKATEATEASKVVT